LFSLPPLPGMSISLWHAGRVVIYGSIEYPHKKQPGVSIYPNIPNGQKTISANYAAKQVPNLG
jgi:hypothetical protein